MRSRRGEKGRDDRRFPEALHHFAVHNITWRALPAEYGPWNSAWKRFWRLSQTGVFEAFLDALAGLSPTAHLKVRLRFFAAGGTVIPFGWGGAPCPAGRRRCRWS